jgi:hypothetical protein
MSRTGDPAPDDIQELVREVLSNGAIQAFQIKSPHPHDTAVELVSDGRFVAAAVRRFLCDYWCCLTIAEPGPECRGVTEHIYAMKPDLGGSRRMYVKFTVRLNRACPLASRITLVSFHPAFDSAPIDQLPTDQLPTRERHE